MLLDTCALLWLASDRARFSDTTLGLMDDVPVLQVSAISGFEIGLKWKAGKLRLPVPPSEWFDGIVKHQRLSVISLDLRICLKATELPPIHGDPCDRFIIATALLRKVPVVTADTRFQKYGVEVLM
jgi:PIN domain nuclease of toxin-antitoxin system